MDNYFLKYLKGALDGKKLDPQKARELYENTGSYFQDMQEILTSGTEEEQAKIFSEISEIKRFIETKESLMTEPDTKKSKAQKHFEQGREGAHRKTAKKVRKPKKHLKKV